MFAIVNLSPMLFSFVFHIVVVFWSLDFATIKMTFFPFDVFMFVATNFMVGTFFSLYASGPPEQLSRVFCFLFPSIIGQLAAL